MIAEDFLPPGVAVQMRKGGGQGGGQVVAQSQQGGESGGGGGGDGGVDGDLVDVVAVEQFDAEGVIQVGVQPGGHVGHQVADDGQQVDEVQVGGGLDVA